MFRANSEGAPHSAMKCDKSSRMSKLAPETSSSSCCRRFYWHRALKLTIALSRSIKHDRNATA